MTFSHPAPHWSRDSLADCWWALRGHLAGHWQTFLVTRGPCHVVRDGNSADFGDNFADFGDNSADFGDNSANWGRGGWLG